MTGSLAAFDFDGTITRRDTLVPFLARVAGPARFAGTCARLGLLGPIAAVLVIPLLAAALLAILPGYRLTARLIGHGLASDLAACLILNGTLPTARRITGTLATLPELVRGAEPLDGPALLVVGDVVDRARGPA